MVEMRACRTLPVVTLLLYKVPPVDARLAAVATPVLSMVEIREPKTLPVVTLLLYKVPPVEARLAAVATPVPSMVEIRVFRFPEVLYMPVVLLSIFAPVAWVNELEPI